MRPRLGDLKSAYDEFWQKRDTEQTCTMDHILARRQRMILYFIGLSNGRTALEIGCGKGSLTNSLKVQFEWLVSSDISRIGVEIAKRNVRNSNVEFLVCDALNLPFKDNCTDVVILSEVLEHLFDKPKSLMEIKRVLSYSGKFILTTPNRLYLNMERLIHRMIRKPYIRDQPFDEPLLPCCLRNLVSSIFEIRMKTSIEYRIVYLHRIPLPWLQKVQTFFSLFLEKKHVLTWFGVYQCLLCTSKQDHFTDNYRI